MGRQQISYGAKRKVMQVTTVPALFIAGYGQTAKKNIEPSGKPGQVWDFHNELPVRTEHAMNFVDTEIWIEDVLDYGDCGNRVEITIAEWQSIVEIGLLDNYSVEIAKHLLASLLRAMDYRWCDVESIHLVELRAPRERQKVAIAASQVEHAMTRLEEIERCGNAVQLESPHPHERPPNETAGCFTRPSLGIHLLVEPGDGVVHAISLAH